MHNWPQDRGTLSFWKMTQRPLLGSVTALGTWYSSSAVELIPFIPRPLVKDERDLSGGLQRRSNTQGLSQGLDGSNHLELPLISGWEPNAIVKNWALQSRKLRSSRECPG